MTSRRRVRVPPFATAVLAAVLLAACGGGDESPETAVDTTATVPAITGEAEREPREPDVRRLDGRGTDGRGAADDESTSARPPVRRARRPTPYTPSRGSREAAPYRVAAGLYAAFAAADRRRAGGGSRAVDRAVGELAENVCGLLSRPALRRMRRGGPALSRHPRTACRQGYATVLERAAHSGTLSLTAQGVITDVVLDGRRAKVEVQFPGHAPRTLILVREHGAWKLASENAAP